MHILFVEPGFPANQRRFVRALAEVGATVTAISEYDAEAQDREMLGWLHGFERVSSVCDEQALEAAVRRVQDREWVDRLEATVEAHILPVARVRERCCIPGTTEETAYLCRDKPSMKAFLRDHGFPCAASAGVSSPDELRAFAQQVGFPLIIKPRSGAGAAGTERIDNERELEWAIGTHGLDRGQSVAIEEFVEGHEGFFDTLTIGGEVVHEFVSHYFPGVLESLRERWISPQVVVTNRDGEPGYDEVKAMGRGVIKALKIGTSATHMEWFFGPKGLKFSEIGCRPPGVGTWDLYSAANEVDLYREWAHSIVHGKPEQRPTGRYSAGIINLRPDRDGTISGYQGLDVVGSRFGQWLIDSHLPPPGSPTQPVEAGYMANAWIRLRHPDFDELRSMLDEIGRTVKVLASP